jgi:hypothetical protein
VLEILLKFASAMNVIRMIKLFGWGAKLNERIADKREEELKWLWKRQLLDLLNGNIKYVSHLTLELPLLMAAASYIIPVITMIATYSTFVRCYLV